MNGGRHEEQGNVVLVLLLRGGKTDGLETTSGLAARRSPVWRAAALMHGNACMGR